MDRLSLLNQLQFLENLESRRERRIQNRPNLFAELDDIEFHKRFRLTKDTVEELTKLLFSKLDPPTHLNNSLNALEQVLIALRYYATGSFQLVIGDLFNISQPTVSNVIHKVSRAIASLSGDFITFPSNDSECKEMSEDFFKIAGFPGVIGTIDCTHVRIESPGGADGERFRNRKNYFSLNVQTIINAKLMITHVVARWPGSVHDSTIFQNCSVVSTFESKPCLQKYHLLGDSGYACQQFLLTPILQPQTETEARYNRAHILTRNTVERKYGVLKRRFPCLRIGLTCELNNVPAIIVSCCVLHNFALQIDDPEPPADTEVSNLIRYLASGGTFQTGAISGNSQAGQPAGYARRNILMQEYFS